MRGLDALFHVVEIGALFELAQFLLDRLDLLVQVVLALAFFHLALDAAADALFHLQDVEFAFDQREQVLEPLFGGNHFEHFLFLLEFQRQMRGYGVGQPTRLVDARQRRQDFRRDFLVQFHVLVELRDQRAAHGFDFGGDFVVRRDRRGVDREVRRRIHDLVDVCALTALDQHFDRAIGQFEHLQNISERAYRVKVLRRGLVLGGRFLRDQHDALARFHRGFKRLDGFRAPDEERNDHMREYHHVAQGQ